MIKRILKTLFSKEVIDKGVIAYKKIRAKIHGNDPKWCMNAFYKDIFNKDIDWENPKDLIEKINWLQLNTDTSLWTKCADKYGVRDFVKQAGLGYILNELYGFWDKAEDIDWNKLPDKFVLKTTQGCGEVILVTDKDAIDRKKVCRQLNSWLKEKFGLYNGQTHYTRIHPRIIAERMLINKANPEKSLVDYKIWCFHGEPTFVLCGFDRVVGKKYKTSAFDLEWNNISDIVLKKSNPHYSGEYVTKPTCFNEMLSVARKLSVLFPEVRVDLYDDDGHVVFGELTFTTGYGSYNKDFYDYLGSKIDLTRVETK